MSAGTEKQKNYKIKGLEYHTSMIRKQVEKTIQLETDYLFFEKRRVTQQNQ